MRLEEALELAKKKGESFKPTTPIGCLKKVWRDALPMMYPGVVATTSGKDVGFMKALIKWSPDTRVEAVRAAIENWNSLCKYLEATEGEAKLPSMPRWWVFGTYPGGLMAWWSEVHNGGGDINVTTPKGFDKPKLVADTSVEEDEIVAVTLEELEAIEKEVLDGDGSSDD
jgi:hypothetical protein